MTKKTICFLLDIASFVLLFVLIFTGILMRFVLPPGTGHFRQWLGMSRHGWGDFHFWIAVAFLTVIIFHIYMHWTWIICMFRRKPGIRRRT